MAKTRLGAIIFSTLIATTGWADTSSPSLVATPPQPTWSELAVQQKIVLAPLADDWDSLEYFRQKKWLGIAARFPTMKPDEQRRIQAQMQTWGKLTDEERQLAREKFKTANRLPADEKQEFKKKWEEYVNLPDDEKEKFKQRAASKPAPKPGLPATSAPLLQALTPLLPAPAPLSTPAAPAPSPPLSTPPVLAPAPAALPPTPAVVDAAPAAAAEATTKP